MKCVYCRLNSAEVAFSAKRIGPTRWAKLWPRRFLQATGNGSAATIEEGGMDLLGSCLLEWVLLPPISSNPQAPFTLRQGNQISCPNPQAERQL
jgi:hypothetical protein